MRLIILVVLMSQIIGCSSLLSKHAKGFGHPYEGAKASINNAACLNYFGFVAFPPLILLTIPVSIFDISTTAVAETIFLPADLLVTPEKKGYLASKKSADICGPLGSGT